MPEPIDNEAERKIAGILSRESRYAAGAYTFVAEAVTFTVGRLSVHRHVSARELLEGIRDYAAGQFGVMAGEVLHEWGIHEATDVGRIVYLMIDAKLLAASEEDSPEDFNIDFDLVPEEAVSPAVGRTLPKID